jgi:hypothetical protein
MKTFIPHPDPSSRRRALPALLHDPALWAWLIVALLALLPARAALHVILV